MRLESLPEHLFSAAVGAVIAIDGADLATMRAATEQLAPQEGGRRLLFSSLPTGAASEIAEGFIRQLSDVALSLWPAWADDVAFPPSGQDTLARLATVATARTAAQRHRTLLAPWLENAALQALDGKPPRVTGTPVPTELAGLSTLVCPQGLIWVTEVRETQVDPARAAAIAHGIGWIARHLPGSVAVLFPVPPQGGSEFDRIRHTVISVEDGRSTPASSGPPDTHLWLEPWRGAPHPLSELEQRLARLIADDGEIAPLFCFNQTVETVRGSMPKVDLLWREGRLVVELDGYPDHSTRTAFVRDRQRDFELTLSGYTVLRLANEELAQDCWLAMQKIRDLVNYCRKLGEREE